MQTHISAQPGYLYARDIATPEDSQFFVALH